MTPNPFSILSPVVHGTQNYINLFIAQISFIHRLHLKLGEAMFWNSWLSRAVKLFILIHVLMHVVSDIHYSLSTWCDIGSVMGKVCRKQMIWSAQASWAPFNLPQMWLPLYPNVDMHYSHPRILVCGRAFWHTMCLISSSQILDWWMTWIVKNDNYMGGTGLWGKQYALKTSTRNESSWKRQGDTGLAVMNNFCWQQQEQVETVVQQTLWLSWCG